LQNALKVAEERNNNLNQFMRNFADVVRLPDPQKTSFDLNQLVSNVTQLMKLKAETKQIVFDMQLCNNGFLILADRQQMEQVLINIIKNAIESIEKTGTISFITKKNPRVLIISIPGKAFLFLSPLIYSALFSAPKKTGRVSVLHWFGKC
jgi:two-component system nitrogen regulation sensor histidine kinase NtrY